MANRRAGLGREIRRTEVGVGDEMNTVVALPRLAVYAAASMLLIAAAYSHAQTGAKRVRVSIPGANFISLPFYAAKDKGYYREEGIEVEFILSPRLLPAPR